MAKFKSITMKEAKDIFGKSGDYIILDVRTEEEFLFGHIPGAINIANEEINIDNPDSAKMCGLKDFNQLIYVYCRSGRRSREAAEKLVNIGYSNIVDCGGILEWDGEVVVNS